MAPKLSEIEIFMIVFSIPAILLTATRIVLRRRRLWFDDAWALLSALALIVQIGAVFMTPHPERMGVARYYMIAVTFYTIMWSARLSLLFSIIRINPSVKERRRLYFVALAYVIMYFLLVFQILWMCKHEGPWKLLATPQCHLALFVVLSQLCTDIFADGSLLIFPMMLLRTLEDRRLRRRLMAIFSTCLITTVVSIIHVTYLLTKTGVPVLVAAITEDSVSLIVCNIPVIATAILRRRQESLAQRRQNTYAVSAAAFRPRDQETDFGNTTTLQGTLPVHVHIKVESDTIPCSQSFVDCNNGFMPSMGHVDKVP
jgi:hypothetical protein